MAERKRGGKRVPGRGNMGKEELGLWEDGAQSKGNEVRDEK